MSWPEGTYPQKISDEVVQRLAEDLKE